MSRWRKIQDTNETTTKYQLINSDKIQADQFTAIYLSPEDPDYFEAKNQPVALYHYLLTLDKLAMDTELPVKSLCF